MHLIDILVGAVLPPALFLTVITAHLWWPRLRDLLSTWQTVPVVEVKKREQRSDAAELLAELSGTVDTELVLLLAELLSDLDDDLVLEVLARVVDGDGDPRYADSNIAKFIPGRVADRLAQVRAVRGTAPTPPQVRVLKVRDSAGERVISY